jgi:hypothetical protein
LLHKGGSANQEFMHIRDKPGVGTSKSSVAASAPVNYHRPRDFASYVSEPAEICTRRTTPMEHAYKSHTIIITTWVCLDRNGYTPEVRVSTKAPVAFKTLKLNNAFPTKEEAQNFALDAAKKWIDDKNPKRKAATPEQG